MKEHEVFQLTDVFTPTKPARLTFVERESINDRLVTALQTHGKQLVVYGHSGSGKTTLLVNKLHQIYEGHITTRCITHLTFEHIVLDAFDQLGPYFEEGRTLSRSANVTSSLRAEYLGLKAQVGAYLKEQVDIAVKRVLPPQLTPQALGRLLGAARCCWVLEDFHKTTGKEKVALAQVMKVFVDMADEFHELKIVAIGAVDTARDVVEADAEMRNRIAEISVPLMTAHEMEGIPSTGEELLNVRIGTVVKHQIVDYANGLASVCHQLCLNLCIGAGVTETQKHKKDLGTKDLDRALSAYLAEASDTLKATFDRATRRERAGKYDNCRMIINALAELEQEGGTHAEIMAEMKEVAPKYPAGNLTYYLRELMGPKRGAVIRLDGASGRYSFADPLYRAFAVVRLADDQKRQNKRRYEGIVGVLVKRMLEG